MDFQFIFHQHKITVKCSMEHFALAHWFNSEMAETPQKVEKLLQEINLLPYTSQVNRQWLGHEYSVFIDQDEVLVCANHLHESHSFSTFTETIIEENFSIYEAESMALCRRDDFQHFLSSFLDFYYENVA